MPCKKNANILSVKNFLTQNGKGFEFEGSAFTFQIWDNKVVFVFAK